jgi:uncharacterized protein YuzE
MAALAHPAVRYYPETDTLYVELRPDASAGGEDAGEDLVIHYDVSDQPVGWEIEHATQHPEHVAAALAALREVRGFPRAAE